MSFLSTALTMMLCLATPSGDDKYQFYIGDRPFTPSFVHLDGTPEKPSSKDLIQICDFWMVLGPNKVQRFRVAEEGNEIWEQMRDGTERLVAGEVSQTYWDRSQRKSLKTPIVVNPFKALNAAQLRSVRAVNLQIWNDDVATALKGMDGASLGVVLNGHAKLAGKKLPPLPENLTLLVVQENDNQDCIEDYTPLHNMKELRFLSIDSMIAKIDCKSFANLAKLQHFRFRCSQMNNTHAFENLKALIGLDLRYNRKLSDVSFAAKLLKLQTLELDRTHVADLSMLAGHPSLKQIDAQETPLQKLPLDRPMPALKNLKGLGSKLTKADVERFRKLNPQCKIESGWNDSLAEALNGVDRVRVRSGGTCHRDPSYEKTLYEEKDRAAIQQLLVNFVVDEKRTGFHCMCCGEPSFEFYVKDKLITTVGYHHGQSLRWPDGWPSDAALTPAAREYVNKWLADHVESIRAEQEKAKKEQRQAAEEWRDFLACYPDSAREILQTLMVGDIREEAATEKIIQAIPNETERALAVCKSLTVLRGFSSEWNATGLKEQATIKSLNNISAKAWLETLQAVKDDRTLILGAARLWFRAEMGERLEQSDKYKWRVLLAVPAMQIDKDEQKLGIIKALATNPDPSSVALLKEIFAGRIGKAIAKRDAQEPNIRFAAAIALASCGEKSIVADVETLLMGTQNPSDRAALEVALAILGDSSKLKAEHFQFQSYQIGFGALQAIEKFRGAYGLDILIQHGVKHPWAMVNRRAEELAQEIIGKEWPVEDREDALKNWWKTEGAAFVARKRAEKK